jgi:predicted metal-dependent HD superfamily phosphohydrolase
MSGDAFLAEQWRSAHSDLGVAPSAVVLADIIEAWSGEGRFYHAIAHLIHGLKALEAHGPDIGLVRLAWFFHDAIYIVGRADNEARSADWFGAYADRQGLDEARVSRGRELILLTRDHQGAATGDPLWPVMNDVDLAIFAAPPATYQAYADNVWREYQGIVTREQFVLGRSAFMAAFRARPIFVTEAMKPSEPLAHANIDAEIQRLAKEARREGWA